MWRITRFFILGYALLCGLFYAYQHLLYFQPKALDVNHVFTFPVRVKFSSVKIPFDENTTIDVVKFKQDDTTSAPKGVVLFFHGNRFNVEHYSTYAPYFTKHGYEVWMPDYPGYGRSTGEIETGMIEELAVQLYQMARVQYAPEQIMIYGKSLGTGVASYLASRRDCRRLVLETPYYSLSSLTQGYAWFIPVPWLMRFNLKTGEYFKDVNAPITVLAAANDELITLGNTMRLMPEMKTEDAFYILPGCGHNGLPELPKYHEILDSVCRK